MTTPEILNSEIVVNKISFPLVTLTAYSAARFDSYRILKSGYCVENFLDRLIIQVNDQVSRM
jgi:hypothetical protein